MEPLVLVLRPRMIFSGHQLLTELDNVSNQLLSSLLYFACPILCVSCVYFLCACSWRVYNDNNNNNNNNSLKSQCVSVYAACICLADRSLFCTN